jgi:hypothetical protein
MERWGSDGPEKDPGVDDPLYPPWNQIRRFLLGALWDIVKHSGPWILLVWTWLRDPWDKSISWPQLWSMIGLSVGLPLLSYGNRNKRLLQPPRPTASRGRGMRGHLIV